MNVTLIGSGSLSLGLLCPWLCRQPTCRLSVITRQGRMGEVLEASREYEMRLPDRSLREGFDHDFLRYDPRDLDSVEAQACIERLEQADVAAVSVGALRLSEVAALIARACLHRQTPTLHLLAFENTPGASQRLFNEIQKKRLELSGDGECRALIPHGAIPDRACKREIDGSSLVVSVERFGEILLEDSARDLFPEISGPAAPVPSIRHVSRAALTLGEMRKFWLVNGTHTALGVLCADRNVQLLNLGLAEESIAGELQELHREWVHVLQKIAAERSQDAGVFSGAELAAHAARMFDRLSDLPDFSVMDVLRELADLMAAHQTSQALHRLLQKLDERLADAVRTASEAGGLAVPASGRILATGIGAVRRYADTYLV